MVLPVLFPLLQSAAWCSRGLFSSGARTPVPLTMSATSTPPSDLLQLQSMALPLLEAASNQVMLPGDAVTIRLHDAPREWAHAIDHSLQHCDGLVGQLLCMKKATHNNGFTVASWLPVLRVVETRRQGGAGGSAGSSEVHPQTVKLVCIGRARLRHSSGLASAEAGHEFNAAPLAEYADAPLRRDELDTADRYVREIDVLSQQYGSLKTKLQALGPEELVFRQPDDYSMTYRGSSLRGEPTLCADYMRRSGQLRDVLQPQQSAADGDGSAGEGAECAVSSLHALHELWNVQHEHAAEVQLASFAACSWFGPITRLRAAQCQTTLGRLRLARGALTKLKQREAAKLALRQVEVMSMPELE